MSLEKPQAHHLDAHPTVAVSSSDPPSIPATITLVRFYPESDRWDLSPWVNRLEALLTFSECTFEIGSGLPPLTPGRRRLPVMHLQQGQKKEVIPDSLFGYNELVKRGLVRELDVGLSPEDLAKSRAIQSLVEEIFLFLVREGWVEQYHLARDEVILSKLPFPIRFLVGRHFKQKFYKRCELSGFSFKRPESEVDEVRQTAVDALAIWVGEKRYVLGGDSPTRADAAIFGFLVSAYAHPHWLPKLAAAMKTHSNLQRYAEGLRKTWYPDRPSFV